MSEWARARDLMEAARRSAIEAERTRRALERMASREGPRAQSYSPGTSPGRVADPMATTDERMDYEARMRTRVEADYAIIDEACDVIYGSDQTGSGGVCSLLGSAYADCLWWRFCAAATWAEVAEGCGMSERWCRDAVSVACDVVDAYGVGRVVRGLGLAEG